MHPDERITVICKIRKYTVCHSKIKQISNITCSQLRFKHFSLSVNFVSIGRIRELNKDFRSIDRPTDVLAFPLFPRADVRRGLPFDHALGDVVICVAMAAKSATRLGQGLGREVCFLLVHGILHLCGYDHRQLQEEEVMLSEQRRIMAKLDAGLWRECVVLHNGRRN